MRHIFKLLAASVAAATICSCSSLTGYPTDAEASYAKAIEIAKKSVDTDKFKVYSLSFMEGEPLSDNLFLISVKLVNKDNQAFSQSYYMTGLEPTALSDVQRTFEAPEYETTVGIDLTKLDAAQIAAQIAQVGGHGQVLVQDNVMIILVAVRTHLVEVHTPDLNGVVMLFLAGHLAGVAAAAVLVIDQKSVARHNYISPSLTL